MNRLYLRQADFLDRSRPKTAKELSVFLTSRASFSAPLFGLEQFFSRHPEYMERVIPFLWIQAKEELPLFSPLHEVHVHTLTQLDALRILAHSFFCSFERDSYRWGQYPSINMDRMFVEPSSIFYAKLCMFFAYFERQRIRMEQGDSLQRRIIFRLQSSSKSWEEWQECTLPLRSFSVYPLQESIDDAKGAFRVDFANRYLGGAALSHGCVQEEIMFVLCPELNIGRLFCAAMEDTQTIIMQGAEQFSLPKGYGWSFSYGGPYEDPTPIVDDLLQSHIIAMDAVDYRYANTRKQYTKSHILRDINKCYSGFCTEGTPDIIATGNWGCGVFGGNAEFKSLLQWASASMAGKSISYFPFDHSIIAEKYALLMKRAEDKNLRVCDLISFLSSVNPSTSISEQYRSWLETQ